MLKTVAYVLLSFPEPSETFIADEALSVQRAGVRTCFLTQREGTLSVVHPSAQALLRDAGDFYRLGAASRLAALRALAALFARAPLRTGRALWSALRGENRWCRIQALPAARWCLRNRVEFLHAHFADSNLVYAEAISGWTGIPYGVTTHRYDILDDPLDAGLAGRLFRHAGLVVTISEFNRRHMVEKYGLDGSAIRLVHCGIDLSRFAWREPRRAPGGELRLLNVGRLSPIKGQDVLLRALALVKAQGIAFRLDIVGGGPLDAELKELAHTLGLARQVTFHGAQPEAFVRATLEQADLFVLPSRSEGLPVACIEALAVGTPVVATRIFGIPELIDDGISGFLVAPEDPATLADAICRAVADPARLAGMRRAGRAKVEAEFDRASCTRELVALWSAAAPEGRHEERAGLEAL